MRRRAFTYFVIEGRLFHQGFPMPLFKCIEREEVDYVSTEIHLGSQTLAKKALRARYYWPTMDEDANKFIKKGDKCQRHVDVHIAPPTELTTLTAPWPFAWWGIHSLGPFLVAPGGPG